MAKKPPNKETKEHYKKLVELGCVVCLRNGIYTAPCIHHLTGAGMGLRSDSLTQVIPLCHTHHQGSEGIHHLGVRTWEKKYGTQESLLEYTKEKL